MHLYSVFLSLMPSSAINYLQNKNTKYGAIATIANSRQNGPVKAQI